MVPPKSKSKSSRKSKPKDFSQTKDSDNSRPLSNSKDRARGSDGQVKVKGKPVVGGQPPNYIVPLVVYGDNTDAEGVSEPDDDEDNEQFEDPDPTQHYFSDQLHYKRPKWTKPWFAMATMVVAAVDVSSVSSFPAKVANNGGLSFFLAYFTCHAVFVLPYLYMEGIIGQYFQISTVGIWGICPLFRGISVGSFVTCFLLSTFYPSVVTWAAYMMVEAAKRIRSNQMVWATCNNDWNTCVCDGVRNEDCPPPLNRTQAMNSPAREYFLGYILSVWKTKYTDPEVIKSVVDNGNPSLSYGFNSPDGLGAFILPSGLILCGIFFVIFLVVSTNFTTSGWIYTSTTVFPLVVLILLLCRALSLEGALGGIGKYMNPSLEKLISVDMWLAAAHGAFVAMSAGLGIHLTAASYNPVHHDVFRDVAGCICIDSLTRMLGCLVMFAFTGHAFEIKNLPLPDVYEGSSLQFQYIQFADVIAKVSGGGFFAFLLYVMIIICVLDTSTVVMQTMIHSVYEEYRRKYPDHNVSELIFLFGTIAIAIALSMMAMTRGGYWVASFGATYCFEFSFNVFSALQSIVFAWLWGIENVCTAVNTIYGQRPHMYFRLCWKFLCPVMLLTFIGLQLSSLSFEPQEDIGETPPRAIIPCAITLTFISAGLCLIYILMTFVKWHMKARGFTLLMLLISPEYEHAQIREDVWSAKRLHWKHWGFLSFPDEGSCWLRLFGCNCCRKEGRNTVSPEGGHHPHQQHHHHHRSTDPNPGKRLSASAWSLASNQENNGRRNSPGDLAGSAVPPTSAAAELPSNKSNKDKA